MKKFIYYIFLLAVSIAIFSCKDDPITDGPEEENEHKEVNEWIYSKMSENYLWYGDIPEKSKLRYTLPPKNFFESLLSDKDGKSGYYYSYIEESNATKSYMGDGVSLGFEYQAWQINYENLGLVRLGIQVLYVLPNSPASEKGIKRGDWIFSLNDKDVPTNFYEILEGTASIKVGVASNINITDKSEYEFHTITPRKVEDNPIYKTDVLSAGNKQVGYLAYNHFTTGPEGSSDHTYDNQLKEAIISLAGQGIEEFILDLRYNGGGYVSSAQVLSSYLLPQSKLDNLFCKMTYNDKQKNKEIEHRFVEDKNYPNPNLQLDRIFVIISPRSASASELVIAALKPYMSTDKIILMGDTSEGKNVGSVEYEDSKYDWVLHPIVCYVTNKDGWDYSKGIPPTTGFTYTLQDDNKLDSLQDLGDPEEEVLKRLLTYIETGVKPDNQVKDEEEKEMDVKSITSKKSFTPLGSSLDRKKTNGVLLN